MAEAERQRLKGRGREASEEAPAIIQGNRAVAWDMEGTVEEARSGHGPGTARRSSQQAILADGTRRVTGMTPGLCPEQQEKESLTAEAGKPQRSMLKGNSTLDSVSVRRLLGLLEND